MQIPPDLWFGIWDYLVALDCVAIYSLNTSFRQNFASRLPWRRPIFCIDMFIEGEEVNPLWIQQIQRAKKCSYAAARFLLATNLLECEYLRKSCGDVSVKIYSCSSVFRSFIRSHWCYSVDLNEFVIQHILRCDDVHCLCKASAKNFILKTQLDEQRSATYLEWKFFHQPLEESLVASLLATPRD